MPIYEYQCPACGHVFEEWGRINDDSEHRPCPHCAGGARRVLSNTAFMLKGGGWYVTDYGYRKNVSEDGAAPASAAEPKAEKSAPATAAEPKAESAAQAAAPPPAPASPSPGPAA